MKRGAAEAWCATRNPQPSTQPSTQLSTPYARLLAGALRFRWGVIATTAVLVAGSLLLLPQLGTELFPSVDAGSFEIRLKTIPGTRLEETEVARC